MPINNETTICARCSDEIFEADAIYHADHAMCEPCDDAIMDSNYDLSQSWDQLDLDDGDSHAENMIALLDTMASEY